MTPTRRDARKLWSDRVADEFDVDTPLQVEARLSTLWEQQETEAWERFGFHFESLDASLATLLALERLLDRLFPTDGAPPPTFSLFLGRLLNLTSAIRRLLLVGLEEPARVVTRSLLETGDIAVAALSDDDFGRLVALEHENEEKIWREEIAFGQINERLTDAGDYWGVETQIANHIQWKRKAKGVLSASTHSTGASALRSRLVPGPDGEEFKITSLGGHSTDTPNLISVALNEIAFTAFITWSALRAGKFSEQADTATLEHELHEFVAHARWLDELRETFPDELLVRFGDPKEN